MYPKPYHCHAKTCDSPTTILNNREIQVLRNMIIATITWPILSSGASGQRVTTRTTANDIQESTFENDLEDGSHHRQTVLSFDPQDTGLLDAVGDGKFLTYVAKFSARFGSGPES